MPVTRTLPEAEIPPIPGEALLLPRRNFEAKYVLHQEGTVFQALTLSEILLWTQQWKILSWQ